LLPDHWLASGERQAMPLRHSALPVKRTLTERDRQQMKKSYHLTFDGSCSTCTTLASAIEDIAKGKLSALSIRSEQARDLLGRALPGGHTMQPYLIIVCGDTVTAVSGTALAVRLTRLLGLRRGIRVYNLARRLGVTFRVVDGSLAIEKGVGRAEFLRQGALFAGAVVALPRVTKIRKSVAQDLLRPVNTSAPRKVLSQSYIDRAKGTDAFQAFMTALGPGHTATQGRAGWVGSRIMAFIGATTSDGQRVPSGFVAMFDETGNLLSKVSSLVVPAAQGYQITLQANGVVLANINVDQNHTPTGYIKGGDGSQVGFATDNIVQHVTDGKKVMYKVAGAFLSSRSLPDAAQDSAPHGSSGYDTLTSHDARNPDRLSADNWNFLTCLQACSGAPLAWLSQILSGIVGGVCAWQCALGAWINPVCDTCAAAALALFAGPVAFCGGWCAAACGDNGCNPN